MNYDVFDSFLKVDTWYTGHWMDNRRFFVCLDKVVRNPDFNADGKGEYFRTATGVDSDEHPFAFRVRDLIGKAWAVREYLEVTGAL
jgi:hypothetical protein